MYIRCSSAVPHDTRVPDRSVCKGRATTSTLGPKTKTVGEFIGVGVTGRVVPSVIPSIATGVRSSVGGRRGRGTPTVTSVGVDNGRGRDGTVDRVLCLRVSTDSDGRVSKEG